MSEQIIEVHNTWTIYGSEADGSEAAQPFAQHSRPQDWGHPRWVYNLFHFEATIQGQRYINHCHCWTDLQREPGQYAELFASLIVLILMPSQAAQLCGRDYLAEEDFWHKGWGKQPPIYEEDTGDIYEPAGEELSAAEAVIMQAVHELAAAAEADDQADERPAVDYEALNDDQLEPFVVEEMKHIHQAQPITIKLPPAELYALIGLLQLAASHPGVKGYPGKVAINLVGTLAGAFGDTSAIAESIRRGWN